MNTFLTIMLVLLTACKTTQKIRKEYEPKIELAVFIDNKSIQNALDKLVDDTDNPIVESVYYFDSKDKLISNSNIILRMRKQTSTVKIRPIDPQKVPDKYFSVKGFKCEHDMNINGAYLTSCSIKKQYNKSFSNYWKIFDKDQISLIKDIYNEEILQKKLIKYGPAKVLKWKFKIDKYDFTLEYWTFNGINILELSTKVKKRNYKEIKNLILKTLKEKHILYKNFSETKSNILLNHLRE